MRWLWLRGEGFVPLFLYARLGAVMVMMRKIESCREHSSTSQGWGLGRLKFGNSGEAVAVHPGIGWLSSDRVYAGALLKLTW